MRSETQWTQTIPETSAINVHFDILQLSVPFIIFVGLWVLFFSHLVMDYTCQDCDEEAE